MLCYYPRPYMQKRLQGSEPFAAISTVIYSEDLQGNLVSRSISVAYITYFSINRERFTIFFNGYLRFLDT